MDIIIVDDETKSIELLEYHLKKNFSHYNIVGKYNDISSSFKGITELRPSVVFLDINMPNGTGLELLNQIEDFNIITIFLTAHAEYAIEALRLNAFDYLLKPINVSDLVRVDMKIIKHLSNSKVEKRRRVRFQISNTQYFYEVDDIIYAHSQGNYTTIFSTSKKPLVISKNLKKIEMEVLNEFPFFRTHQSYIVNLNHVSEHNNHEIILRNKNVAYVSNNKYDSFKRSLISI